MNFERICELFDEALALPADAREPFLSHACAGDPALAEELSAMLRAHGGGARWFDSLSAGLFPESSNSPINARIGPYKLLSEIGRGGMGAVYFAQRDDGQFDQQVALKLVRLDQSPESMRRFLAERQILSRLHHPGIAQLLDGGAAPDGRPYIVMEYVDGKSLAGHCEGSSVRQRLALFIKIASAVDYAHRNLIVHRDIKPGNILITASGEPKLLDFGIAKLLDPGHADSETRTGLRLFTPGYAAPEQLRGDPVTTAADVYGLGAVLYEMLAGDRPIRAKSNAIEDLEQAILHADPPPPSIVNRSLERELRGDLDTICLKALAKDPDRRYPSAAAFIADVEAYLRGHPISARRDSPAYRARKFIGRHKLAVGAATVVVALVAVLLSALAVASARATRERDNAQRIANMFVDLFSLPDPADGATITAREILDRGVRQIDETAADPEVHSALLDVLGRVHHQLGLYERSAALFDSIAAERARRFGSGHASVAESRQRQGIALLEKGDYTGAIEPLQKALAIRLRENSAETAATLTYLGLAHFRKSDYKSAEPLFRESMAIHRSPDSLTGLAMLLYAQGNYAGAEPLLRESLELLRKSSGSQRQQIAETANNLASVLSRLGRDREAEAVQREALDVLIKTRGPNHPRVATALNNLALILYASGDLAAAEPLYRKSLQIRRDRLPATHPDLAQSLSNLGLLLQDRGAFAEAEKLYVEALDVRRKSLGGSHVAIVQSLNNLGQLLQRKGDLRAAEAKLRESLEMGRKIAGSNHPMIAISLNNLASVYDDARDPRAESHYRESLAIRRGTLPAGHPHIAYVLHGYGKFLSARSRTAEAEPLLREALLIRQKVFGAKSGEVVETERALNQCLRAMR
jgi:serine/threonine-protein kinase